jgi:hypothetical protein
VEILSVGVAFLDICDAGALLFPSPLNDGKSNDLSFQTGMEVSFIIGELPTFEGLVEVKNDKQSRMQHDLSVGEAVSTPLGQHKPGLLKLMVENMARFRVGGWLVPSIMHHLVETGNARPKVLKLEGAWLSGATIVG